MTCAPTIYAVVCTDVDGKKYVFAHSYTRTQARYQRTLWLEDERQGRKFSIVKYVPAQAQGTYRQKGE